jgi:hypothetical protein
MMFDLPWKLIGLAAGAAVLALWALFTVGLIEDRGKLQAQLDQAIDVSNANAQAAVDQRAEFDRIQSESVKAAVAKALNNERANQRRKDITDAPDSDDGPLSPVLRHALDGLRSGEGVAGGGAPPAAARGSGAAAGLPRTDAAGPERHTAGRGAGDRGSAREPGQLQ